MKRWTIALALTLACTGARAAAGQTLGELRTAYDAAQYQQVAGVSTDNPDPRVTFLVGQSLQRLRKVDDARRAYEHLAARPENDPWRGVGESAAALLANDMGRAVETARAATSHEPDLAEAHYQLGLALAGSQDFAGAAAEFQKAVDLDPEWAYAHYYAGLAYSKVKRVDLTASHFDTFLKLAPRAPERGEVQSILRTLGAR